MVSASVDSSSPFNTRVPTRRASDKTDERASDTMCRSAFWNSAAAITSDGISGYLRHAGRAQGRRLPRVSRSPVAT